MSGDYYAISLDAESNGLHGQAFCIGMTASDARGELGVRTFRCPIVGPVDPWVAEKVLPVIEDIPVDCEDYAELLAGLRQTWADWGGETRRHSMITHVPWPVEARLLLAAFPDKDVWKGPYPLIDVSNALRDRGFGWTPPDRYLRQQGIALPAGSPHNPLYDCRAAERAHFHLATGGRRP